MTKPIDLNPDHARIVHEVLARHLPAGVSVRVFGSRAKWTAKTFSDLDLAVKGKEQLPHKVMVELTDALEESDLPFGVDVIDWHAVAPSFQAVIDRDGVAFGGKKTGEWQTFKLRNLGRIVTGKTPPTSEPANFGGEILFVTPSDMTGGRSIDDTARSLTEIGVKKVGSSYVSEPAVVVSCIGSDMGKAALVNRRFVSNQQINAIIPLPEFDRLFIYYNLSVRKVEIRGKASGAAQPIMNKSEFGNLELSVPDLPVQKAIGHVLSTLDDKIELNRRMNATLEGMAQAIFRDWFVDFGPVRRKQAMKEQGRASDPQAVLGGLIQNPARAAELAALFPDALGEDGLPVGWERLRLSDIATLRKGSVNPQIQPNTIFEHYSLPAFDKRQEPSMDAGSAIKSNKTPVAQETILLSKLNPETLRVWLPNDQSDAVQIASTEFLVFAAKTGASRSLLFALFRDQTFRARLQGMVTGTSKSHQRISPPALMVQDVIAADQKLFPAFESLIKPMVERLLASRAESNSLAETRDYLLPRLMSGKVRVGDAARIAA